GTVDLGDFGKKSLDIQYRYILKEADGNTVVEWGDDRILEAKKITAGNLVLVDTWNHAGDVNNAFFTKPFQEVLLASAVKSKSKEPKAYSHIFKVKAPLLQENEVICICGDGADLGSWSTNKPILLTRNGNWWEVKLTFTENSILPVRYKYGVYNAVNDTFVNFEAGSNRELLESQLNNSITQIHDGFVQLPYPNWKGTGVAIPVFSIRTKNSLGAGEFTDIKLLVDWAKQTGLKLIQLLPINDTTATHTWTDSYPYAAISAFALHPMFLNIEQVAGTKNAALVKGLKAIKVELNELPHVDYERVMEVKMDAITKLYEKNKDSFQKEPAYIDFFENNHHWLVPYAAFCYLRDKNNTADYNQWETNTVYDEAAIVELSAPTQKHYDSIALHYYIQYQLHLQLVEATAYAHEQGIIVKGDLPIGIYRYSCDAWLAPQLYNMNAQAGAPPDDFAVKGQNWGFPTYNWKTMQEDGFTWWRRRFAQMSNYFDAFRIDHILGFFRIWSIPLDAVEGILGHFVPAIPIHINELYQQAISYQHHRYCKPYITEAIVHERFGNEANYVKEQFLYWNDGSLLLKGEYDTQRKVEQYFAGLEANDTNEFIKIGLYDLISNVIFIEEEGSQMQQFHFRIGMEQTTSFRDLDEPSKQKLKDLYVNYFFRRQDDFWKKEAMNKLPELKRTTNMLVCGEDLGMVPDCVPDVMQQLGMLSLEIQRMPKDPTREFFHPAD
ncbi:MAG: 4-alpha-glucanotransferase, partial [Ferruginibacter sp.]